MYDERALNRLPITLEGVVFDMDGLLLDTEAYYRTSIFDACSELGAEMTDDIHLSLIGTPKELGDQKLRIAFGSDFRISEYHKIYHARFAKLIAREIPIKRGAKELLVWLFNQRIPVAITTSAERELAISNITKANMSKYVEVLISRSDVTHGKPHPESYLSAISAMGVDIRNCVAFEDSYNGIRSAAGAGIPTIMIPDMLPATCEMSDMTIMILDDLAQALAIFIESYQDQ